MRFNYTEIEAKHSSSERKTRVYRPIIRVDIFYRRNIVGYEALIDSGADYCVFHADIADILGIVLKKGSKRKIIGIGGEEIKGYEHAVKMRISQRSFQTTIIFSKEIPPNSFGVLGNRGFFDKFLVNFNYKKRFFELS